MRGKAEQQALILSTLTPDQLVPQDHPIRQIKPIVDRALAELSPTFNQMYAQVGRPSTPPRASAQRLPAHRPVLHPE